MTPWMPALLEDHRYYLTRFPVREDGMRGSVDIGGWAFGGVTCQRRAVSRSDNCLTIKRGGGLFFKARHDSESKWQWQSLPQRVPTEAVNPPRYPLWCTTAPPITVFRTLPCCWCPEENQWNKTRSTSENFWRTIFVDPKRFQFVSDLTKPNQGIFSLLAQARGSLNDPGGGNPEFYQNWLAGFWIDILDTPTLPKGGGIKK